MPKDDFKLSLYDGDLISADGSWRHFKEQGCESVGVLAITCAEGAAESLPACPSPEIFREHAHLDFRGLGRGQIEAKAKRLRTVADKRGWQYRP
jgi:hypothetical protein